jgi:drug/metabolite transporter (DMT)-like permease
VTNPPAQSFTTRQSVLLVFLCTLIGAAAQVFMKTGGARLHGFDPARILTDLPLLAGYACYALNTLLLMLALRDGELSKLYPIIALTFVWVNILSIVLFQERLNAWKVAGMLAIMSGVAMLGRASEGAEESRP